MEQQRYLAASDASNSSSRPLTQDQVQQWRVAGYTFVRGLFDPELINAVTAQADAHYPPPGSAEANQFTDFGSAGALSFPTPEAALNRLTLDFKLLNAIAQLLSTSVTDLRLTQSDLWAKYGREERKHKQDNQDQRIHVDYPNHTIAHPSPWNRPEAVELIVYYSDHADTAGSTAIVPRWGASDPAYAWPIVGSPGIADLDYINDRAHAEAYLEAERPEVAIWRQQLYQRESYTQFKPGDVLFYRHDTWHRGTPMKPGSRRLVHNITYRKASAEWYSTLHVGWSWSAYRNSKFLERLIASSSLEQRAVLGFPQPGNAYWCDQTIEAVGARYRPFGMDMSPYQNAMEPG